jgi:hypothetical protein
MKWAWVVLGRGGLPVEKNLGDVKIGKGNFR